MIPKPAHPLVAGRVLSRHARLRMKDRGTSALEVAKVLEEPDDFYRQPKFDNGAREAWLYQRDGIGVATIGNVITTVLYVDRAKYAEDARCGACGSDLEGLGDKRVCKTNRRHNWRGI